MKSIQYTLRDVPVSLDRVLRQRMREEGLSLNAVLRRTLMRGAGLDANSVLNHDFDDLAGKWVADRVCEEVIEEQRGKIDQELWQ
jgi:hypothetical protein